jgi:hypothetical protein
MWGGIPAVRKLGLFGEPVFMTLNLKVLMERFGLIERKLPVFAKPEAKHSLYYVTDNFLRSWLAALVAQT